MLTIDALKNALPLTEVVDSNGFRLLAVPGTPLDELVKATRSDANFNTFNNGEFQPDITNIEYIANCKDPVLGFSQHDNAMDHVVEVATNAVREHMTFAKNVVAPAVQELVEKTAATLNAMQPSSLLGMEVVAWEPPKPLDNSSLQTAVKKFEETPYDTPALAMKLPDMAVSDIAELMGSGAGSLDKDVAFWLATKGDSFLINLWENVFQIKQAGLNDKAVSFRDFIEDRENGIDNALGIFLIARKLFDNPPKDTQMPMVKYNDLMADYRNQAGAKICRVLADLEKIQKNKVLIRSIENGRTTIVNNSVYRAWIENGGDNEVLFGNAMSRTPTTLLDSIVAQASELKGAWQRHATLVAVTESNNRFARTKEVLARHFDAQLRATEGQEATQGNRETVSRLFNDMLADIRADEIDDLWKLGLKLVCRARFHRTEAERILSGMERIKKQHPEVDVREAAAASIIEYIAYWVGTQFKVVKI